MSDSKLSNLTGPQALIVRLRFQTTPGYSELSRLFPSFCSAIDALPSHRLDFTANFWLMDMLNDAIIQAVNICPLKS